MQNLVMKFIEDERGVAAIEYGLIASTVALAIIGGLRNVGENLTVTFETIEAALHHA